MFKRKSLCCVNAMCLWAGFCLQASSLWPRVQPGWVPLLSCFQSQVPSWEDPDFKRRGSSCVIRNPRQAQQRARILAESADGLAQMKR